MTERLFPIMPYLQDTHAVRDLRNAGCEAIVIGIPWEMIAPHEKQAQSNHGQSLSRLAERGGLGADEAVNVMTGTRWGTRIGAAEANHRLTEMVAAWRARVKEAEDAAVEGVLSQMEEERAWFKSRGLVHPADASYAEVGARKAGRESQP